MANMIKQDTTSLAWLEALEYLNTCPNRKASNLSVVIGKPSLDNDAIRAALEATLTECEEQSVNTVANTIFPQALYLPDKFKENAREHLYDMTNKGYGYAKQHQANRCGRYIQRLIAYPAIAGPVNQLEQTVQRLRREMAHTNALSSNYEIGIVVPGEDGNEDANAGISMNIGATMQIIRPDYDTRRMGFPCLSHISLTLENRRLHMSALSRNQHFFRKAYGNYVGLSRLLNFFCQEVGCNPGEILCLATHADTELGKRDLTSLIDKCRIALVNASNARVA